jgi:alkylhydroperoxidase family enzyme
MTDPPARIPQLGPEEWSGEAREVFGVLTGVVPGQSSSAEQTRNPVLRTFAHHPALTKPFLSFNRHVLSASTLPARLRQIAILRVAWIRCAVYMWSSHLRVSLSLGLTREDFDAVKIGESSPHWSEPERTLIRAVDRLVEDSQMSDATWSALGTSLDRKQILDLLFTVGCYTLLTMVLNSLRIEREPDLQALAAEYGAP